MEQLQVIQSKIYEIRGQKVMLDRDLAEMYDVQTKVLNQAVKRNIERFPEDFMFQLTSEETNNWRSQFVTSNSIKMGLRRNPYAFTELGVAMLSSILSSKLAIQVNINIMRAFVAVRQMIALPPSDKLAELQSEVAELKSYVEEILSDQNDINEETAMQLELINQSLAELQMKKRREEKPRNPIGFIKPKQNHKMYHFRHFPLKFNPLKCRKPATTANKTNSPNAINAMVSVVCKEAGSKLNSTVCLPAGTFIARRM